MGQNPRKDASAVDGKDGRERNADDGECGKNGDGKSEEKLGNMIEASFMLAYKKHHAE